MENREMFQEINALIGAIAKALDMSEAEVVKAVEAGDVRLEMMADDQGRNCIEASSQGRVARVYQGAIFRPGDRPEADADQDCDTGCSCGH